MVWSKAAYTQRPSLSGLQSKHAIGCVDNVFVCEQSSIAAHSAAAYSHHSWRRPVKMKCTKAQLRWRAVDDLRTLATVSSAMQGRAAGSA